MRTLAGLKGEKRMQNSVLEKTYRKCKCHRRHEDLNEYVKCVLPRAEVHGERLVLDKAYAAIIRCKRPWAVWLYTKAPDAAVWAHPEIECSADCTGAHEAVNIEPCKPRWLPPDEYQRQQRAELKEARLRKPCPKCEAGPGEPCKGVGGNALSIMHGIRR